MARTYEVQGRYDYSTGWETVCEEDTAAEALARLREYRSNEPQYPHRIRIVHEPHPITRNEDGTSEWANQPGDSYLVTGTDLRGRRFRVQCHNWLQARSINVYHGTLWLVRAGRRYMIHRVHN